MQMFNTVYYQKINRKTQKSKIALKNKKSK